MISREIRKELFAMQDPGYREFQIKLMPTVDPERVIAHEDDSVYIVFD